MRWLILTLVCHIIAVWMVAGQVSQGGTPLDVPMLKSRGVPKAVMPAVNNSLLMQLYEEEAQADVGLKPFRFAHGFEVNISPETDGLWVSNIQGFDVWQIKILSEGAHSIHLVFDKFHLSNGSRLFIFNENTGHMLGAFTSANNKASNKFATAPVAGDELTIQYEIPAGQKRNNNFVISIVNHDYVGILKYSDRKPTGISAGLCNIDVNCLEGDKWMDEKDAVCRIITTKRKGTQIISEICSGALVNNTAQDQKPYIITAAHCIEEARFAETSVFTFNYESPYCAPLTGDPGNSISGSVLRAISDSLDFALVELSLIPPPEYRPYFAGWDRSGTLPDSTKSIHHPQGDIKKISTDFDPPLISDYSSDYTPDGFLKVKRWDAGVTEQGSSGGPLFNPSGHIIGSLTGGSATCNNPVNDLFSRFKRAWEFKSDSSGQLKYWLDPLDTKKLYLAGKQYYTGEDYCQSFTNLEDFDEHQNVVLNDEGRDAGYWGGTNQMNITEFAERFSIPGDEQLYGVSMGIGLIKLASSSSNSIITVKVYTGRDIPENVIYSQNVPIKSLVEDAMNFIPFDRVVEPTDTFFVGFELTNLQPQEEFVLYQSLRLPGRENFFWFRQDDDWFDFQAANSEGYSMTNVFELLACNVNEPSPDLPLIDKPMESVVYPNPTQGIFTFEAGQEIFPENVKVYDLLGKEVKVKLFKYHEKKVQVDLSGNIPGVYFVRFNSKSGRLSGKVIYNPW